jgi:CRISPR-associated protein Cmr3
LKMVRISGPLLMKLMKETQGELFLPAPKDILFFAPKMAGAEVEPGLGYLAKRPFRPHPEEEGCDLPAGLFPVAPDLIEADEIKGMGNPAFWSMQRICEWLSSKDGEGFNPPPYLAEDEEAESRSEAMERRGFLRSPAMDTRTHVKIDSSTFAAEEQMLFSTTGLDMAEGIVMSARITDADGFLDVLENLDELHPLGGERRLAHWSRSTSSANAWCCPETIRAGIDGKTGVRMVLASPGIFEHGWKPGWLNGGLIGHPPDFPSVTLRLAGAVIDRWQPISGWSLESNGPKPVKRLVPAGSVYFFHIEEGDPLALVDQLWLQSICDRPQDRQDGFGLALWGVWDDSDFKGGV